MTFAQPADEKNLRQPRINSPVFPAVMVPRAFTLLHDPHRTIDFSALKLACLLGRVILSSPSSKWQET